MASWYRWKRWTAARASIYLSPTARCGRVDIDGYEAALRRAQEISGGKASKEALYADPFSGCVFVFRNRSSTAIKLIVYDGQGFWLAHKRLSAGHFRWWPEGRSAREVTRSLAAHQLQVLLAAGDPSATGAAPVWRPVSGVS